MVLQNCLKESGATKLRLLPIQSALSYVVIIIIIAVVAMHLFYSDRFHFFDFETTNDVKWTYKYITKLVYHHYCACLVGNCLLYFHTKNIHM